MQSSELVFLENTEEHGFAVTWEKQIIAVVK